MNTPVRADFQSRVRLQLRRDALDTAYKLMTEQGWSAVTMTAIATAVRVSRQTLYREFPSKEQLGQALVIWEAERFIDGVTAHVAEHDEVAPAIEAAVRHTLDEGAANPRPPRCWPPPSRSSTWTRTSPTSTTGGSSPPPGWTRACT